MHFMFNAMMLEGNMKVGSRELHTNKVRIAVQLSSYVYDHNETCHIRFIHSKDMVHKPL